jgi:hypothetical protein
VTFNKDVAPIMLTLRDVPLPPIPAPESPRISGASRAPFSLIAYRDVRDTGRSRATARQVMPPWLPGRRRNVCERPRLRRQVAIIAMGR